MISLRQLHYFVEIVESGGFSRAAERLFVAQSALSRQVRELEDSIGTPLLRRGPRQVELTPAGRAFLPRAQRLLGDLEAARRLAREVGEGGHGLLRLGHSSSVPLVGGLQAALRGYLAAQSGVRLELTQQSSEQQLADLAEGRLDSWPAAPAGAAPASPAAPARPVPRAVAPGSRRRPSAGPP